jgi:hemerythrin-like domain-containing protein
MNIDPREISALISAHSDPAASLAAPRVDMYAGIHKALRALMAHTLLALGRMDVADEEEFASHCERVMDLLDLCRSHLQHENTFVHAAIEARAPGAARVLECEHGEHEAAITALAAGVTQLLGCAPSARPAATQALYRQLALFIAHNFEHMHAEETTHNSVLWAHYSDGELMEVHNALVASIPPEEMMAILRWLVPFMSPPERTAMLADMRAHAPAPVFAAVLDSVKPHLTPYEWIKLMRSLDLQAETAPPY